MTEDKEQKEDIHINYNSKSPQTIAFIVIIAFFVIALSLVMYANYQAMVSAQDKITRTYNSQCEKAIDEFSKQMKKGFAPFKEMEASSEEIKYILNSEYEKIQSEYESLEIWTGLITVVFLIFSFYSLFKTEGLEKQSREALNRINETALKGDTLLADYKKRGDEILENLGKTVADQASISKIRINEFIRQMKNTYDQEFRTRLNAMNAAYTENTKAANDRMNKQYEELAQMKKSLQDVIDDATKKIASLDDSHYDEESDEEVDEKVDEEGEDEAKENTGKENTTTNTEKS